MRGYVQFNKYTHTHTHMIGYIVIMPWVPVLGSLNPLSMVLGLKATSTGSLILGGVNARSVGGYLNRTPYPLLCLGELPLSVRETLSDISA